MKNATRIAVAVLAVALVCSLSFGFVQYGQAKKAQRQLGGIYERAALDLSQGIFEMDVQLMKVLAANSPEQLTLILDKISTMASDAQKNLAQLPIDSEQAQNAMKLFNQVAGYAATLSRHLVNGQALTQEENANLVDLSKRLSQIDFDVSQLEFGNVHPGNLSFENLSKLTGDYPALLYDGPFSDAKTAQIKGLTGEEISLEQATEIAQGYFSGEEIKAAFQTQERQGDIPAWGIGLQLSDMRVYLQITKKGGHLLLLMADEIQGEQNLSPAQMRTIAAKFLEDNDYGDMQWTFEQVNGDHMVFNFVPVQEDVLLYPDLVKVQVSARNGKIVAVDADGYVRNHVPREIEGPLLDEAQARGRVGLLEVKDVKLCIAPLEQGEVFCYQFLCKREDSEYLIYINAMTGAEENILVVILDAGQRVVL